ncbi:hypothetical protein BGS_0606 [Beggiatoa sp. SS]|nr:hypothetical protein BGS_0606 [Beggiatoa sp. SS]
MPRPVDPPSPATPRPPPPPPFATHSPHRQHPVIAPDADPIRASTHTQHSTNRSLRDKLRQAPPAPILLVDAPMYTLGTPGRPSVATPVPGEMEIPQTYHAYTTLTALYQTSSPLTGLP